MEGVKIDNIDFRISHFQRYISDMYDCNIYEIFELIK
jgi:hypothetical protein